MTQLIETMESWGTPLTSEQVERFACYATELERWNERLNLTGIRGREAIEVRLFLDALWCTRSWGVAPTSLVDVGSGAGFPGLPLKIFRPSLQLTLIESIGKKAAFLRHIANELGLAGVTVLTTRAELVGHAAAHREHYDVATARAVAELRVLAEYCLPLVRLHGRFLAPKGAAVAQEVEAAHQALHRLGGRLLTLESVTLPALPASTLVVIEKVTPTPPLYPREVGVPARKPL